MKCPECERPVSGDVCVCGWKVAYKKPPLIKQCFHCHNDIPDGKYYRIFHSDQGNRYKCADCLLYADLDWRDKHFEDWKNDHPEFKFKPETDQDQKDLQEICMAYIRKITRGGTTRKLPYDKTARLETLEYNEQELLARAPKEITFADLEEPLEVGK